MRPPTLSWDKVFGYAGDSCLNIMKLIDLLLSLPPTSVTCERSFSHMKLLKNKRRGRLNNQTLDNLMVVKLESDDIRSFDPKDAIQRWNVSAVMEISMITSIFDSKVYFHHLDSILIIVLSNKLLPAKTKFDFVLTNKCIMLFALTYFG